MIDKYKKKLEEAADVKRQMKVSAEGTDVEIAIETDPLLDISGHGRSER